MRAGARWAVMPLVALVMAASFIGGVRAQPAETTVPGDARIQRLLSLHVLLGTPDGNLQLERQVNGGEFVVMLERVLQQPAVALQRFQIPSMGSEATSWTRTYAWVRGVWNRVLAVRGKVRHLWFGLRTRQAKDSPWGIDRSHWAFISLRNVYLDDSLIDLSFQPMKLMSGSEGITMLLTAAGFGGEVAAMKVQMHDPVGDESLRVVCRQHGFDKVMEYAGKPLTRRNAALLAWRLLVERTSSG